MKTKQNAPLSDGSTSSAACSRVRCGYDASSAVTRSVSVDASVDCADRASWPLVAASSSTRCIRSPVSIRLPLWPRAIEPVGVERNVGCALRQTLAPVVE